MKCIKAIIWTIAAFTSWVVIGISGSVRVELFGKPLDITQYSILLCLSLWFLQYSLDRFLLPLSALPKAERRELLRSARTRHKAGLFAGIAGLGYFLAILYVVSLFATPTELDDVPNLIIPAVFFIVIGTITEARTLIKIMAEDRANK